MDEQKEEMKPIWYFVGWMLLVIGILVVIAGFMNLFTQSENIKMTSYLHPDLWWGGLIVISGIFYILKFKKQTSN